jgi:hypothetical protein
MAQTMTDSVCPSWPLLCRTVTDVSVNTLGLLIAAISVITSGMQQILCGTVQRKHNLTSTQLLANTAPVQVESHRYSKPALGHPCCSASIDVGSPHPLQGFLLMCLGPFIDQLVSKKWIMDYEYSVPGLQVRTLHASCEGRQLVGCRTTPHIHNINACMNFTCAGTDPVMCSGSCCEHQPVHVPGAVQCVDLPGGLFSGCV